MKIKKILHSCLILLLMLPFASVMADDLKEGEWQGALTNSLGKRYKIKYNIHYNNKDDLKELKIEMIYLDLEPMPDYTYQLTDIKLNNEKLSFNIPREYDSRICTLTKQDDNNYAGMCQSNKAVANEISHISMDPLPDQ